MLFFVTSNPQFFEDICNNGHLKILRSGTKQYDEVRSYKVAEDATWAAPVFLQGKILIKDVNTLTLWTY